FQAADDALGEDLRFDEGEHGTRRRERLQGAAEPAQIGELVGAVIAPFEVRADGDLVADRELAVVERLQPPARFRAGERRHAVLASRSSRRSAWRARVSRDFTVPTATPSEKAISL